MKRKKLNWNNLCTLVIFVLSVTLILYDLTILTVATFMGKMAGWTWLGFITFVACWVLMAWSYEELQEIIRNKKEK